MVFILLGCLEAATAGPSWPVSALIFSKVTVSLGDPNNSSEETFWSLMFAVTGIGAILGILFQLRFLQLSSETLTRTLRSQSFRASLHQKIGYFDLNENAVGAFTTRLPRDASQVQGLCGGTLHRAQTLQASSSRLFIFLASIRSFLVWTSRATLLYQQSTKLLERRVFVRNPAPEFELDPSEYLKLLLLLYGLSHAGELWHEPLNRHLLKHLNLEPTKTDPSLYFSFGGNELVGIHGSYDDDRLRAGDAEFRKCC